MLVWGNPSRSALSKRMRPVWQEKHAMFKVLFPILVVWWSVFDHLYIAKCSKLLQWDWLIRYLCETVERVYILQWLVSVY